MSTYEDAVQAAVEPVVEGLKARQRAADFTSAFKLDTSLFWNDPRLMVKDAIDAFLAALPSSIVVDGQVVEFFDGDNVADWAWIAATPVASRAQGEATIARLLDAAREVAKGGQQ